jgi:LmbE family N-acetylglucosaminyl deacetylase
MAGLCLFLKRRAINDKQISYIILGNGLLTMNILAIGAHPDDIELGCGGTLLKAVRQGHNVYMYNITRGSASGDPDMRVQELIHSSEFVGVNTLWIDNFEDTKLSLNSQLVNHIEYFIGKAKPDLIYTHSGCDNHHDHRAIAAATIEAGRFVPNIVSYEMPVTRDFKPQVYFDISDVIDEKIKLLNVFYSQRDKMFIKSNAIRGLAYYRALQSRLDPSITSVEAFEVVKLGFATDFKILESQSSLLPGQDNLQTVSKDIIEYHPTANLPKQEASSGLKLTV